MKKKNAIMIAIITTMIVVTIVSFRVGHVTFAVSARTCCINSKGFVFAIPDFFRTYASLPTSPSRAIY